MTGAAVRVRSALTSRRSTVVICGLACLGLTAVAVAAGVAAWHVPGHPPDTGPAGPVERPPATPVSSPSPSRDDSYDQAAVAYYRVQDRTVAAHVREAVWTGPMLRVYTDLPAADAESRIAIELCRQAAAYAEGRGRSPMVFVHARARDGYPVLANKLDEDDSCRLNGVP